MSYNSRNLEQYPNYGKEITMTYDRAVSFLITSYNSYMLDKVEFSFFLFFTKKDPFSTRIFNM